MRTLVFGHAYSAAYNRIDKLSRLASDKRVQRLGVVIPSPWHDRMMDTPRNFSRVSVDDLYDVFTIKPLFTGSQSKYLFMPNAIAHAIESFNPDVIHVEQEPHDLITAEIIWMNLQVHRRPIVVFTWENIQRPMSIFNKRACNVVLKHVDHIIAGNRAAVSLNESYGYKGKASVLPQFGVDTNRFRKIDVNSLKESLGLRDRFIVGFVGRYTSEKGIGTLIEAVKKLAADSDIPRFTLLLMSSMQPPKWITEISNDLKDYIRFVSSIPHEEFPRYMNLFDVLVLPSESQIEWQEQFGRVLIEAMACEVPTIGSSSGAIPEVIGDHGWIFPEKNSLALSDTLKQVMLNPSQLNEKRHEVREYVTNNFTHEVVCDQTIKIWEECINK
ncbi:glycosyltransferase [candidate division WWE3 bacterium]|nr:glycosyltransferase [candidate division WWE3 bacterium]